MNKKQYVKTEINNPDIVMLDGWLENWFWPVKDEVMWDYLYSRRDAPIELSKYCESKNSVIQAGGNIGYYPKKYSKLFKNVYTFEPDSLNFNCLTLNTLDCPNIFKFQAGLGSENKTFSLDIDGRNCGGHKMGNIIMEGNIPIFKIDNLGLKDVSLIHLDVEGQEENCLRGAIETIKLCKPIIIIEIAWSNASGFLEEIGYNRIGSLEEDNVFEFKG